MKTISCGVAVLLLGCGEARESGQETSPRWSGADLIRAARLAQNEAIASHDLVGIGEFWTADVVLTGSDGNIRVGFDAYRNALASVFERFTDAAYVRTPDVIKPSFYPYLALEEGSWRGAWTDNDTPVRISGTYTAQWRLEAGGWRIRSEVFVALLCEGCPDLQDETAND